MCGVVGICAADSVNQAIYDALTMIQHRGQDAAGIMTSDGERVYLCKGNGLVRDVVRNVDMMMLKGRMGLGHVRYPTAGTPSPSEAQPIYVNSPYGLSIVHNGNLTNAETLHKDLVENDHRHLNTGSDSEILLNIFAHELQSLINEKTQLTPSIIFKAVKAVHKRCQGGYAVIVMIVGYGLVAFRDPNGIRPLILGRRKETASSGFAHMVASESVALDALSFDRIGDVLPGEAIFIDLDGQCHRTGAINQLSYSPCIFEYIYLARPDSVIDRISVYQARLRMGEQLAKRILAALPSDYAIDVVVPVPDTSRTAALSLARCLDLPYREGFVKNRYIGRTFIMPGQFVRKKSIKQKLNVIDVELKGKCVLLVDDSIVRGNTSRQVIQMAREAGAKQVYFASVAPPVYYPNVYGIDMPSVNELVAYGRSNEEIKAFMGADWLIYQELEAIYVAIRGDNQAQSFEDSIFTGRYITGSVTTAYLNSLAKQRSDRQKIRKETVFQPLSWHEPVG